MANEHIVKSYDEELKRLRAPSSQMGGLAESQLELAIEAVVRRDADLAGRVMRSDEQMDAYEASIDAAVVRHAGAAPADGAATCARSSRRCKIACDLERIGDYATNIAKRVAGAGPVAGRPAGRRRCRAWAGWCSRSSRTCSTPIPSATLDKALAVWRRDEEVDDIYNSLFRELLTYMMEDPRNITPCTHLLFIAKNLERIGDHATNIAETVHFLVTGKPLDGARPKGDTSSLHRRHARGQARRTSA